MKKLWLTIVSCSLLIISASPADSVEFVVEGNGGGDNTINASVTSDTTVNQTNNAQVNNDITSSTNTGANQASGNAGNVLIETGSAQDSISVENSLNTSLVSNSCCDGQSHESSATIANNGSGTNEIILNKVNTTDISITQNASVINIIKASANTGKNSANDNNGNVIIKTGSITSRELIENKNINTAHLELSNSEGSVTVRINGNGEDSENNVTVSLTSSVNQTVNNTANVFNDINHELNTGHNTANGNSGDVLLETGDIAYWSTVRNVGINYSFGKTNTCCDLTNDPDLPPTIGVGGPDPVDDPASPSAPPVVNQSNPSSPSSSNNHIVENAIASVGSVLGGSVLPATGSIWWLYATMANILMFLMGLYLRLRAGRSPCYQPYTYAYVR